jgi:outer membrane protein, heavy metal efflux system
MSNPAIKRSPPLLPAILLLAIAAAVPAADVNLADGISPDEAVALALTRSPQIQALRKGRSAAELGVPAAKVLPDPEIRTGRVDFVDDAGGLWSQNYNLALRWSPPRLGERNLKGSTALGKVSEVTGEIAVAEQRLAAEVRLLHMKIVFLDEQIKLADAAVKLREQMVEFLDAQVEAGVKNILDQNMADLSLADARSVPAAYRLERRVALNRLAAELGLARSGDLKLQVEGDPLGYPSAPLDSAALVASALARRPEFAVFAARCAQADAGLDLASKERYPWLSFVQLSRDFGGSTRSNTWGLRFGIDLPIFKWSGATVGAPAAEAEQCRMEIEAARSGITVQVEESVERLRSSASDLDYYRQSVQPLSQRAVDLTQQAVEAGQADLLQRLTAEARSLSHQQTFLAKLLDYRTLEIELDQALGRAVQP